MPRSHPLFAPFSHDLSVDNAAFEWTIHGADFCFRPQGARADLVHVLPGCADFAGQLALEDAASRVQPYVLASQKIIKAWRARLFWRFHLDDEREFLLRPTFGLLRQSDGQSAQFAYPRIAEFHRADEAALRLWRASLDAPDSDFGVARRWLALSKVGRLAQLVDINTERWDELIALLEAAFVLWARPDDQCELDFSKPGAMAIFRKWSGYTPRAPVDEALKLLNQRWNLRRADLGDFARYWRGCDVFGDPMDVPQPAFKYRVCSQHERLEALLLWRNWLRDQTLTDEFAEVWQLVAG